MNAPADLRRWHSSRRVGTAFTLVELLVVIGIIAVLIGILMPSLSRARESSNRTICMSNQRQIIAAMLTYANEHHGYLPGPAVPCVNNPQIVNQLPGETPDPAHPDWSQLDVWCNGGTFSPQELSSSSLLQGYLGGPSNWKIWQCPSAQDVWSNAVPTPPPGLSPVSGDHLDFSYMINNVGTWDKTYPSFLFGAWTGAVTYGTSADQLPKKLTALRVTTGVDPSIPASLDALSMSDTKASTFVNDSTRVWVISDLDGRNFHWRPGGIFSISAVVPIIPAIEDFNRLQFQPTHRDSQQLPTTADPKSGFGRNYGFLDGHVQYLSYGDWPGSSVLGSIPN